MLAGPGNKVSDIIGKFDNGPTMDVQNVENTPGKVQPPKRTRKGDGSSESGDLTNPLSAASGMEAVREQ